MNKLNQAGTLFLIGVLFTARLGPAQTKSNLPRKGNPPRSLIQQPDGHWSANKLAQTAEGVEVHTVKAGDTLWDITEQYLKDPYLWPQVWEINSNITNPHWIYPGDKILIKKMVVVSTSPEPTPQAREESPLANPPRMIAEAPVRETPIQTAELKPVAPGPEPVATYTDFYCSGFFSAIKIRPEMVIVGGEESEYKSLFSDREVVYMNKGASAGVKPGDEFLVLRRITSFGKYGPGFAKAKSKSKYGFYYQDIGQVRVILTHERSATAEIVFACEEMNASDLLIPYEQRISPIQRSNTAFDKFAPPSNKTTGTIFMSKDYRAVIAKGHIVYIDVGEKQNVQVGDYFRVVRHFTDANISLFNKGDYRKYRQTFDNIRKVIGELVVLRVEAKTSTALVTLNTQEITLGDGVEQE